MKLIRKTTQPAAPLPDLHAEILLTRAALAEIAADLHSAPQSDDLQRVLDGLAGIQAANERLAAAVTSLHAKKPAPYRITPVRDGDGAILHIDCSPLPE
jgi:hypothetical protein